MEEVHMFLNGELFGTTEARSADIRDAVASPEHMRTSLSVGGKETTFKYTVRREGGYVIMDMERIH